MPKITMKQSIFLAIEIRSKILANVEAEERETGVGQRYAAFLLDRIVQAPEGLIEIDQVQRDLGYAMAIIVERRSATKSQLDQMVRAASEFDMNVRGAIAATSDKPKQTAVSEKGEVKPPPLD